MEPHLPAAPVEPLPEAVESAHAQVCPCCGGFCIELRGFWRCPRCCYRICEACEAETGE